LQFGLEVLELSVQIFVSCGGSISENRDQKSDDGNNQCQGRSKSAFHNFSGFCHDDITPFGLAVHVHPERVKVFSPLNENQSKRPYSVPVDGQILIYCSELTK
jgi:hypothetical protein